MDKNWLAKKKIAMDRLKRDIKLGRVDPDIVWILNLINSLEDFYTTSSCSGRIQITANRLPGDKFSLITLAKWHHIIKKDDFLRVVENSIEENLWFSVQPPILHIACKTLDTAIGMLRLARNNGFKHAGIQGITDTRIVVEITSTERIEVPIRLKGKYIISLKNLDELITVANNLLLRSKGRLVEFGLSLKNVYHKDESESKEQIIQGQDAT